MLLAKLVLIRSTPQDKEGYPETQNHITPLLCLSLTKNEYGSLKRLLELFDNSFATAKMQWGQFLENEHEVFCLHVEETVLPKLCKELLSKNAYVYDFKKKAHEEQYQIVK